MHQGAARRAIAETLELGWRLLDALPREDLLRLGRALLVARAPQRAASRTRRSEPDDRRRTRAGSPGRA